MKLVKPGLYTIETDLSCVWFCGCGCGRSFKQERFYLSHIRKKKINKIVKRY